MLLYRDINAKVTQPPLNHEDDDKYLVSRLYTKLLYRTLEIPKIQGYALFDSRPARTVSLVKDTETDNPINFTRYDFELEDILEKGIEIKEIRDLDDLRKLTEYVYRSRRFEKTPELVEQRYKRPLGNVWKNYGATCIEFAGVEFALLTLLDIMSDVVYVKERHMFLEINIDGKYYVADPNKNFVIPKENYLEEIRKLKKKTSSYENYNKLSVVQNRLVDVNLNPIIFN